MTEFDKLVYRVEKKNLVLEPVYPGSLSIIFVLF